MCEAYVIPFLFGSFFTVCHPYIDVHFLKCFFCYFEISRQINGKQAWPNSLPVLLSSCLFLFIGYIVLPMAKPLQLRLPRLVASNLGCSSGLGVGSLIHNNDTYTSHRNITNLLSGRRYRYRYRLRMTSQHPGPLHNVNASYAVHCLK